MNVALTVAILFCAFYLGGVAAFGANMIALPLLLWAGWDLRSAMAVVLVAGGIQPLSMACLNWRAVDFAVLIRILIMAGLGIPLGFATADILPERALGLCLGSLLIIVAASRLIEHLRRREWQPPAWCLYALLLGGGVLHGAFGNGGATLTVYGRYALPNKGAFRGTLSIMWVILNAIVVAGLVLDGDVDSSVAVVAVPGVPAVLLATWLGHRVAKKISDARFADAVAILLFMAGAATVARNMTN